MFCTRMQSLPWHQIFCCQPVLQFQRTSYQLVLLPCRQRDEKEERFRQHSQQLILEFLTYPSSVFSRLGTPINRYALWNGYLLDRPIVPIQSTRDEFLKCVLLSLDKQGNCAGIVTCRDVLLYLRLQLLLG